MDPYADSVVSFGPGAGTFPPNDDPESALGAPEEGGGGPGACGSGNVASLGVDGELVVEFVDNVAHDGPGLDITLWGGEREYANVFVSFDGIVYVYAALVHQSGGFDLAGTGLTEVLFVKIVDAKLPPSDAPGPGCEGYDVDAVEALNSGASDRRLVVDAGEDRMVDEGDVVSFTADAHFDVAPFRKLPGNPVLDLGPAGEWDAVHVMDPSVVWDGTDYHLWYQASDGTNDRIGHAVSDDGFAWTRDTANPVIDPSPPRLNGAGSPEVLFEGGVFRMWFDEAASGGIAYAESSDGSLWTFPVPNPVLPASQPWENGVLVTPTVARHPNGTYVMLYSQNQFGGDPHAIGVAWSSDGLTWTKYAGNPVLTPTGWEGTGVYHADLFWVGDRFKAWYAGGPASGLGYAESFDAVSWARSPSNPVSGRGTATSWDSLEVFGPSVLQEGGRSRMWYAGDNPSARVGHAVSEDGLSWAKRAANPVLVPGPGGTDAASVDSPFVLPFGSEYRMYYMGHSGTAGQLHLATSPDGVEWTKPAANPVLPVSPGTWDACQIPNAVVVPGAPWRMWYTGWQTCADFGRRVGHATSSDGITWTKDPTPVLDFGPSGTWDDTHVSVGTVLFEPGAGLWRMWYAGWSDGATQRIGLATSPDGLSWTKHPIPVLELGPAGAWDSAYVTSPVVASTTEGFEMWYLGSDGTSTGIGSARSSDGVMWNRYALNPVLKGGRSYTWDAGPLGPASVVREGDQLRMWYRGTDGTAAEYRIGHAVANLGGTFTFAWDFDTNLDSDGDGNPANDVDATGPSTSHVYADNGLYEVLVTACDDGGECDSDTLTVTVFNVAPTVDAGPDIEVDEATALTLMFTFSDPGFDFPSGGTAEDFAATVDWGYGPPDSPTVNEATGGPGVPTTGTIPVTHTYGDNGAFSVTVTVCDDDGGCGSDAMVVTVGNVDPSILDVQAFVVADITLRVAGEKWHDVRLDLVWNGAVTGTALVVRTPGSPDDQSGTIQDGRLQLLGDFRITLYYTPDDDPVNGQPGGANPAWVVLTFPDGAEVRLHHTFNVQHPTTWTWTLDDFAPYLVGPEITFETTASDVGSDDLAFAIDFGDLDLFTEVVYNNGVSPDPFPSPDVNPITATVATIHVYAAAGTYTVTVTVTDDDGGMATAMFIINVGN